MQQRTLGRTNIQVSSICLGGNVFGWTIDEATSFEVLDAFVAGGGNFIDSADVYAAWVQKVGISETILGKWMKARGNRHNIILATKCGSELAPDKKGLSKAYIMQAVEASLQRLQTDYIDLYQSHVDDPTVPMEETMEAFNTLVQQGKVRALGCSNFSGARLYQALEVSAKHGWARYETIQPRYNLVDRDIEADQLPICRAANVSVIPYYALAAGFLTGKYRKGQPLPSTARASNVNTRYMNDKGFAVIEQLDAAAKATGATMGQVAVAWLLARPGITAPIASATSVAQVNELVGAAALKLDIASLLGSPSS